MGAKQHTTINLDKELVREAQQILGTKQVTETIHRALEEVVGRARRLDAFNYEFLDLTQESIEEGCDEGLWSSEDAWTSAPS